MSTTTSDAALAAALQAEEEEEEEEERARATTHRRGGRQRATEKNVQAQRVWVVILACVDMVGIGALFLQLSPAGLPLSTTQLAARLKPTALLAEFFFMPAVVLWSAVIAGGVLGGLLARRELLWAYCACCLLLLGLRCFLLFEMSKHESTSGRTPLLIDMIVGTACILFDLSALESAARLALDLRFNNAVRRERKCRQSAARGDHDRGWADGGGGGGGRLPTSCRSASRSHRSAARSSGSSGSGGSGSSHARSASIFGIGGGGGGGGGQRRQGASCASVRWHGDRAADAAVPSATASAAVELGGICCGVPVTSLPPGDMQERPSVVGTPVPSVEGFTFGVAERGGSVRSS
jgi:hypothetical protein